MVFISDIDKIYIECKTQNIEFVGDVGNRDYVSRDFRIRDNNGNILILSSPLINQKALIDIDNTLSNN